MSYETLGQQIKTLRQKAGMTQTELAGLSGVHQSLISKFEAGPAAFSIPTLSKLARTLHVDVVILLVPREDTREQAKEAE